jgi:ubiquitin fusion degradation protein 1
MASKLNIRTDSTEEVDSRGSGRSTPAPGQTGGQGKGGFETFLGQGNSVGGKRVKGKGSSGKKVEEMPEGSKLWRTGYVCPVSKSCLFHVRHVDPGSDRKPRVVTADTHLDGRRVPAALNIPFGHLFFGYPHVPLKNDDGEQGTGDNAAAPHRAARFTGAGATLSGRARPQDTSNQNGGDDDSGSQARKETQPTQSFAGKGNALNGRDTDVIVIDEDD